MKPETDGVFAMLRAVPTLIAFTIILVLGSSTMSVAEPEPGTVRDRQGFVQGRIERSSTGDLIVRDRDGFAIGRVQSTSSGNAVVRDRDGFTRGRINERTNGGYKIMDRDGFVVSTDEDEDDLGRSLIDELDRQIGPQK